MITSSGYKKYYFMHFCRAGLHFSHVICTVHSKGFPKNWLEEMFIMYVMLAS